MTDAERIVRLEAELVTLRAYVGEFLAENAVAEWRPRGASALPAFLDDLTIPFTNNQAERDLPMVKVPRKIAGPFRDDSGATAYCHLRGYLATMRKQGHGMLAALTAVFRDRPFPVA